MISLLLCMAVLFCSVPVFSLPVVAADATVFDYGTTGDCTWSIDTDYTLTISGNGSMGSYGFDSDTITNEVITTAPWKDYALQIKTVVIESGVSNVAVCAFFGCTSLTSVAIPNSVTSIGSYAFYNCSLTSVTIPDSVTAIDIWAFENCTRLTAVYITDLAAWCNILFDDVGVTPLCYAHNLYLNGELVTDLVIPQGVTEIKDCVFEGCTSLTDVTIPDSITSIGNRAFSGCSSLTNVTIPDSVTTIGSSAFEGCSRLTNVTIPDSVTTIGSYAFRGCTGLTSITIPDSVTTIGDCVFYGCTGLTNITIPDSVTTIGDCAFYSCKGLMSITIPNSVTTIGNSAFENCTGLGFVTIGNNVAVINNSAFNCHNRPFAVDYIGTSEQWNNIFIAANNTSLTNAKIFFYDCTLSRGHVYSYGCDDTCNVCGETRTALTHEIDETVWDNNTKTHWHPCKMCGKMIGIENHNFDNACDTTCEICGYVRTVGDHVYDAVCDTTCNECGAVRSASPHYYGILWGDLIFDDGGYIVDDQYHQSHCLVCGEIGDLEEHIYDNACDNICNICLYWRTVGDHVYDNVCDDTCNKCGVKRSAPHDYQNTWQMNAEEHWKSCSICGKRKNISGHYYDNDCDDTCDTCGYIRTVGGHVYDNACDDTCNICGNSRIVGDHHYNSDCDEICSECGHTRIGLHDYQDRTNEWEHWQECSICGKITNREAHDYGWDTEWYSDEQNHWLECWLCGYQKDFGEHVYDNACDDTCNICGEVRIVSGHIYDNTCDATCNECGDVREITHNYASEWTVDLKPTCTESGEKSHHCTVCGDRTDITLIVPYGHTYDAWKYEVLPACDTEGKIICTCLICGDKKTITIDPLGHEYTSAWTVDRAPTCDTAGSKSHHCIRCEAVCDATEIAALGHDYRTFVTEPTCTKDGYTLHVCSVCGDSYKTDTVSASGHALTHFDAKVATCTEIGWYAYDTCDVCDYTTYVEIPATGHDYKAYGNGYKCSHCDAAIADSQNEEHHYVKTIVKPTEGTDGYTQYTCTDCGYYYRDKVTHYSDGAKFSVSEAVVGAGKNVIVTVSISNNPGIYSYSLGICYDKTALTLTGMKDLGTLGGELTLGNDAVLWLNSNRKNQTANGALFQLTFAVSPYASAEDYEVTLTYDEGDVCNYQLQDVNPDIEAGVISVESFTAGDLNGDGKCNNKDLILMSEIFARNYTAYAYGKEHTEKNQMKAFNLFGNVSINLIKTVDIVALGVTVERAALDVNNDGIINNHDLLTMMQYLRKEDIKIY